MQQNNFKQNLQPALKFAGVLGTVGGFVGDVLSPLGPILNYLFYLSIIVLIISVSLLVLLPKSKKEVFKMASLSSLFFSIIFGVFMNLNKDSENGFLGDNVEFVSEFQASFNLIEVKLDEISDQIEVVDEKLNIVDDKIDEVDTNIKESFKNLDSDVTEINEITKDNAEMLNTISYQQEEVLTSIESLNNIGSDLREMLGLKTITFPSKLKSKIGKQLKSKAYKKVFNHFNRRYVDLEYWEKTAHLNKDFSKIAIEQVPNTDIGYYRRAVASYNEADYDSALMLIDSALAVNPKSYLSHTTKYFLKMEFGDNDNTALEYINKAYSLKPNSYQINKTRGDYFNQKKNYSKALKDFKKAYELTNFKWVSAEMDILFVYWNDNNYSGVTNFLKTVPDVNKLIEYIIEVVGLKNFVKSDSSIFLLNTDSSADVSFIESDLIGEIDNVYVGYFQLRNNNSSKNYTVKREGKYLDIDKEKFYQTNFVTIKKPIIDFSDLYLNVVTFYLSRELNNSKAVTEIRNSQDGEVFTVIFKVIGEYTYLSGEVLFFEKGITKIEDIERKINKKLNVTKRGLITDW